jgi:hypothetical protein
LRPAWGIRLTLAETRRGLRRSLAGRRRRRRIAEENAAKRAAIDGVEVDDFRRRLQIGALFRQEVDDIRAIRRGGEIAAFKPRTGSTALMSAP